MQNRSYNILFPSVPVIDTSVKAMLEQGTPVSPIESQFFDQESPLHIYKSFDFNNMPKDPHALNAARNFKPSEPVPAQKPVISKDSSNAESVAQSV